MRYRPEIDGLRALAIVPVILFHAGFGLMAGGFIGVDVFFVISGYLITSLLVEEIENRQFSLVGFYERRARRILPALFFVEFISIVCAWFLMLPSDLKDFSKSLVAVSLFVSNFFFWQKTGYFDDPVEKQPLLHTWSLAVEEQFYLGFPLVLWVSWRFGRTAILRMICLGAFISFVLSEWGWRHFAEANFYLAPARVWELFAGSIAALVAAKHGIQKSNTLATVGLLAIVIPLVVYDKSTPGPSVYTLVPVIGSVLIILFGDHTTYVARLLSMSLLVRVGLISYSAYLWHQPLMAFSRFIVHEKLSTAVSLMLSAASFVLGAVSWKWIELPFRSKTGAFQSRASIFAGSLAAIFVFCTLGAFVYSQEGFPGRLSAADRKFIDSLANQPRVSFNEAVRRREFVSDKNRLLIIGDSYAKDLYEGLALFVGSDFQKIDTVILEIPRRCKNVLANAEALFDDIKPEDPYCLHRDHRVGTKSIDLLISQADLVLVRSLWDVLPTELMPSTYDYINRIAPNRVAFVGSTLFGSVNFQFTSMYTLKNRKRFVHDAGEIKPYTNRHTQVSLLDLITLAGEIMGDRNYFPVYEVFCDKLKGCEAISEEGDAVTDDGFHLTDTGDLRMARRLFSAPNFRKLWNSHMELRVEK